MAAKKAAAKKTAAKKTAAKKTVAPTRTTRTAEAKRRAAAEEEVLDDDEPRDDDEIVDDDEEDAPVGSLRGIEDEDEDEEFEVEQPDDRTVTERIEDLEEEDEAAAEVGKRSRTTTDKNAERERRLRDLADDGSVEINRTITGSEGRGRSIPTKADKAAAKKPRAKFKVAATRLGFYENLRRRPGDIFYMEMEIGKGDKPVHMPSWVVLAKDYVPEDEEGTKPAKKRNAPDFIRI